MIEVSLVGTGGMLPLPDRFLTSLAVRRNGQMMLIDCGESTQVSLKLLGWGFKSIGCICFTHFHADHISGLPGLLLTIGNSGREEPLRLIGPRGLGRVLAGLRVIAPELPFEIQVTELSAKEISEIDLGEFTVRALPLEHRIDCLGYSINVLRQGKFDPIRAKEQNIPVILWSRLQNGETVNGYYPAQVLGSARKGIKVSYITDSRPTAQIPEFIKDSDLFICEGLYGDNDKLTQAQKHMHMIFSEAAALAKEGGVQELWLTHYSPALKNPDEFLPFAADIFRNVKAGSDRMTKTMLFEE